jgi:hypothetical protein
MKNKEGNLNLTVVPSDFLEKMEADLHELKESLRIKNEHEINSQWVLSVEVPKILGISRKTWQTYRDKRMIPFSQIGSKIYVKRVDLERFMVDHRIEAK